MRCHDESIILYTQLCKKIESGSNFIHDMSKKNLKTFLRAKLSSKKTVSIAISRSNIQVTFGKLYQVNRFELADVAMKRWLITQEEIILVSRDGRITLHNSDDVDRGDFSLPLDSFIVDEYIDGFEDPDCLSSGIDRFSP